LPSLAAECKSQGVKIAVTGGRGFLGRALVERLRRRGALAGEPLQEVAVFDLPDGDVRDPERVREALRGAGCVFHLASMVSGECERDFDAALAVNLDGTRHVLEACRGGGLRPRLVLASTLAVYGGSAMPETVSDRTRPVPQTTYGATKAIAELLVNDYTRKGFLDGRSARLPTVIVRPGPPNQAASGFASAVVRELLAGRDYALPVSLQTRMPVIGARTAVECLLLLAEADAEALGDDRALNLPSISVTMGEIVEAVERVAGGRPVGRVRVEPDPQVEAIVRTWPRFASAERALALGLPRDESLDAIVRAYLEDEGA